MPTTNDIHAQVADDGWPFYPDQVETPTGVDPKSSAARIAAQVREDDQDAAKNRDQVLDQLQAERKRREAERAKTAGLSTAEILAARRFRTG
jgi:hypothetical protein